jgi:hypothetical protein
VVWLAGDHGRAQLQRDRPGWILASPTRDVDRIDNQVVDSASIEVSRRPRRAKSDGLDFRKLLAMLRRFHTGEREVWNLVRVPTVDEEDRRPLHRARRTLKEERGSLPGSDRSPRVKAVD